MAGRINTAGLDALADRFWSRVACGDGCWLWTGACCRYGYGAIGVGRRVFRAPRVAWMLTHGSIPTGLHVCHRCDTPRCVRPEHLFLGTDAANQSDKMRKGRGRLRLTNTAAREIVERYRVGDTTQRRLAHEYGITQAMVSYLVRQAGAGRSPWSEHQP